MNHRFALRLGAALGAAALASSSCAHPAENATRAAGTQGEAQFFHYGDQAGLTVTTAGAQVTQRVSPSVEVTARALADHVVNEPPPKVTPTPPGPGQPTGHLHPGVDAVSSASVLAVDDQVKTDKWRFEGAAGATVLGELGGQPASAQGLVRGSVEPDYRSLSGTISGTVELFGRNTRVEAFVLGGHDLLLPLQAPPGEEARWPASHSRWGLGGSISQLLTRRLVLSGGAGFTHQWGTLSSPYRRALIQTSLFPERAPGARARLTAFAGLSYLLGGGTALHLRQGFYLDSWGVNAVIPEISAVKEVGGNWVLALRYRFYGQGGATFYRTVYRERGALTTGDPRLGAIRDHVSGVEVRWTPWGRLGWSRSLTLLAGYELSILHYPELGSGVRAQIFSLGVTGGY